MATPASTLQRTEPVTLLVTRRIAPGRYADFLSWIRRGEQLAGTFPGYLGSGVLSPPPGNPDYQIVFRFDSEASLARWADSDERLHWLEEGAGLVFESRAAQVSGLEGWFGNSAPPPRWKQAVLTWLVFFPVSLLFTGTLGDQLNALPLFWRVFAATILLTPVMVCVFIPLASRLLRGWLQPRRPATGARRAF